MAKLTIDEIIAAVKELNVLEMKDLVKAVEKKFGVSAAAIMLNVPGPNVKPVQKTEFDVELTEIGSNKVKVLKVVRELYGLGLREAKEVVDSAPKILKSEVPVEEAEAAKAALEAEGAKVTLK